MISIQNISKSYGELKALDGISLEIKKGELFGLIGPDGAGKTTLFRLLATLLLPDEGRATLGRFDLVKDYRALRQHIGYMPGRFSLYPDLTVEENLTFFASVFGTSIQENYDLIAPIYVQIEPFKKRRAAALSGGMKQKLALCCALIHRPEFLLLDEPTTGVDPVSRSEFWDMLDRLRETGLTILASTPYMDEASRCERIALIQKGKIMDFGTPNDIRMAYPKALYAVRADEMFRMVQDLNREFSKNSACYLFGEYAHLSIETGSRNLAANQNIIQASIHAASIAAFLESKIHRNIEVRPVVPSIEDCFIELIKNHD